MVNQTSSDPSLSYWNDEEAESKKETFQAYSKILLFIS